MERSVVPDGAALNFPLKSDDDRHMIYVRQNSVHNITMQPGH